MDHTKSPDADRPADITYSYGDRRYVVQTVFGSTSTITELLLRLIVEDAKGPKGNHDTQP